MTDFLTNADHWRKRAELTRALAANAVKDQGRLLKVAEEYDRLAKADARIASEYDAALVEPELRRLGEALRARLGDARRRLLAATGHAELLQANRVLQRSIAVRNPYVDPINLLQVELLRRLRSAESPDERLWTAFAVTVNGIAAGMRNTG